MITLKKQSIDARILERYATIVYAFYFENTRNVANHSDELRFSITIDPNAFIAGFTADIDGQLFIGRTEEKEEAKQEYTAAKQKNENAILISQPNKDISNVFQIKTNIDSQSQISLHITIEQYLQKRFSFNQLNVQLLNDFKATTISKSYSDIEYAFTVEDKRGISHLQIPLYSGQIDTQNKYAYKIKGTVTSQQLSLTNELVLKYKIDGEAEESALLFDAKTSAFCHVISDVTTDAKEASADAEGGMEMETCLIPRRVVFVVDKSGSMRGNKWNYTVTATNMALKKLRNGIDRYRLILCGSSLDYIPKDINTLELAEEKSINESVQYLQQQRAMGCEQLNLGLLQGIKAIKMDILKMNNDENVECNFYINQIIFISDGKPTIGETNVDKIIANVKNANDISKIDKYSNKISVFTFGVGRDGNGGRWMDDLPHSFMKSLAVNNDGFYKRIKQKTADQELSEYMSLISKPVSTNISIKYDQILNGLTATEFHSLYEGNDLIVCGKLPSKQNMKSITAVISSINCTQTQGKNNKVVFKPVTISKTIKMCVNYDENMGTNNIERIWAYLHLQQCATNKLKYNDMIEMDDSEQREQGKIPLQLAMKHKFVTPWTSMIVVQKKDKNTQTNAAQTEMPRAERDSHRGKTLSAYGSEEHKAMSPSTRTASIKSNNAERDFYKTFWIEAGKIGEGAFSKVRTITRKSDKRKFDLKMIKKKGKSEQDILSAKMEIDVLTKCKHQNIIELESSVDTKKRIYIVIEMCDGGDMIERIVRHKRWSEQMTIHAMRQIVSGLEHLHGLGFAHRNITPENLIYVSNDKNALVKITEFELVGSCDKEGMCTDVFDCGTINYSSPEIISSLKHGQLTDLWSVGVIIYILLCGFPPFFDETNNGKNLCKQIVSGKYSYPSPYWNAISKNAKDLIRKLLVKDVKNRWSAKQVLTHEWFKDCTECKDKNNNGFGTEYIKQISHWNQNIRWVTEICFGEDPPPTSGDQILNLYSQKNTKESVKVNEEKVEIK